MTAGLAMLVVAAIAAVVFIIVLRALARRAVIFVIRVASGVPPKVTGSRAWARSQALRSRLAERHPALSAFVADRLEPRQPTGLPMTLMVLAAIYLAALFSGLTEDILEADGTIRIDSVVNAAFSPWRIEPLISAFLWITALGSSPSVISAVIIATGFLWSQRRFYIIVPLWVTCLGALATTTIGKFMIGRHRPEFTIEVSVVSSSFPSGHATAAMAVYGFIAYAIARALPGVRGRFEVAYWTAVLIFLVGFSRIFLGVHYLTDVTGGFFVGGFWLLIGFTIAERNRPLALSEKRIDSTLQSLPEVDRNR
jgi:membrane-associated phospholipid phosphatase